MLLSVPLSGCLNLIAMVLSELGLSFGQVNGHAGLPLLLFLDQTFPILDCPLALGLAVEHIVLAGFDAEGQPFEEPGDLLTTLGFDILQLNAIDVLLYEVEGCVGLLSHPGLVAKWCISSNLVKECIVK
jgi:hypothetical protein